MSRCRPSVAERLTFVQIKKTTKKIALHFTPTGIRT